MDSAFLAVAGIVFLAVGIAGFVAVSLFFAATAVRYAVLPALRPLVGRVLDESRDWLAPPERPRTALARAPTRTSPNR